MRFSFTSVLSPILALVAAACSSSTPHSGESAGGSKASGGGSGVTAGMSQVGGAAPMPAADLGAFPEMNNSAEVTGVPIGTGADVSRLRRVIGVAASVEDFAFGEAVLSRSSDTANTFQLAIAYKNVGSRERCFADWGRPTFSDGRAAFVGDKPLDAMGTIGTGTDSSNYFIGCLRPNEIGYLFAEDLSAHSGLTFESITSVSFSYEPNEFEFPQPPTRVHPVAYAWEAGQLSIQIQNIGEFPASVDSPFPYVILDDQGTVLYLGQAKPVCTGVLRPNESTWAVDRPFDWIGGGTRVRAYVTFDRPDASGIDGRSAANCQPEPVPRKLFQEASDIKAMVADEQNIYYVTSGGDVRALPVMGGQPTTISTATATGALARQGKKVYWATSDPGVGYRDDTGAQVVMRPSGLAAVQSLAVAGDVVYVVNGTQTGRLMSMLSDWTLTTLTEHVGLTSPVWADGTSVFYAGNEADGTGTYRLLLATGEKEKLSESKALAFSGEGGDVYWVEESYGVGRWSAANGSEILAAVTTFSTTTGFAADASGAYWAEGGDLGKIVFHGPALGMNRTLASGLDQPRLVALNTTSLFWSIGAKTIWGMSKPL